MSVIHQEKGNPVDERLLLFPAAILLMLIGFTLRLWYLQVAKADYYLERDRASRMNKISKLAPRGLIVDRNDKLLAGIKAKIVVTARPSIALKDKVCMQRIAHLLNMSVDELTNKLEQGPRSLPIPLKIGVPISAATKIAEDIERFPGYAVEQLPIREYPDPLSYTHLLGHVGTPTEKDVERIEKKGLKPAAYVGKYGGIEQEYEELLAGIPGTEELGYGKGAMLIPGDNPVPGSKLILSLDTRLQTLAMKLLDKHNGGVVAIDPRTGGVLCLASKPTYDVRLFEGGISRKNWKMLNENLETPLVNRAISTAYAPGSTFKIVTTIAAQMAGKFSTEHRVHCPGFYQVGNRKIRCLGRHGSIAYKEAFTRSCNTYFSSLARDVIGEEWMRKASLACGLGAKTGIDLSGESRGVIPTKEWLEKRFKEPRWYPGDLVNFGIGQGYVATTPLQMANLAALVANKGVGYHPHLLKAYIEPGMPSKTTLVAPQINCQIEAPEIFWQTLHKAMQNVIDSGTAASARIPGLAWGGKTGSAEDRRHKKTHSWFVAFAPVEQPKIAICVLVEGAGHGGAVATPIAKQLVQLYLQKKVPAIDVQSISNSLEDSAAASASPVRPERR